MLCKAEKSTNQAKELKEQYISLVVAKEKDKESWTKFYKSDIQMVVKLEGGCLVAIEKPRIQKDFCFGYSDYDADDYDRANGMVEHAQSNENYFLSKNLDPLDAEIAEIADQNNKIYHHAKYWTLPADSIIHEISSVTIDQIYGRNHTLKDSEEITQKDREVLVDAYTQVRKSFEKRLHTYLKKYGLSKINCWSYWQDE